MKKKLPKFIYSNLVNEYGLYSKNPIRCMLKKDTIGNYTYWDKSGNYDVDISDVGKEKKERFQTQFSSVSKREIELWIQGSRAVFDILKEFNK